MQGSDQTNQPTLSFGLVVVLQDAAIFLRDNEALFVGKISTVVIVGGAQITRTRHLRHKHSVSLKESLKASASALKGSLEASANGIQTIAGFAPDVSEGKIQSDITAAEFFYSRCQQLGIPLIICPEEAAYGVSVSRRLYDDLAGSGSLIGWRLREV